MALSAGARQAVGMAAGWLLVAGSALVGVVYVSEIKQAARVILRLPAPAAGDTSAWQTAPRQPAARQREPARALGNRSVEIRAGAHGHYYAQAEINGRRVDVLVDTGASIVAMPHEDASRAGVYVRDSDYTQRVSTANGFARVAPVMLDRVSIGDITVRNVPAAVMEPGKLATTLLGMSFLGRLQRVDMRAGMLILQE
jgi:aspartyl protease family protein